MSYQDINEIVEVAKSKIEVSVKDQNAFNSPSETVEVVNHTAEAKKVMPSKKTFVLALLAGGYIAMGSLLALVVGGAMPGLAA